MRKYLTTLFNLVIVFFVSAQDVDYARTLVDELASEKYHGRGYVKKGDSKAAKFLAEQFNERGLDKFNNSYFQKYSFPINTFPGRISVSIDNKELIPGEDYVISLSAPTVNEKFEIHNIAGYSSNSDSLVMAMDSIGGNGIFLINEQNTRDIYGHTIPNVKAVALLTDKTPYWHVSNGRNVETTTWLKIKKDKIPSSAKSINVKARNKFINDYKTQNVVAYVEGSKYPESYIVFTAHYDHLGMMGNQTYYPGANDNASGTAMILDLARHFSLPENQPEYSVVFIALSGEESGLYGSRYYVEHPLFPLEKIKLLVNLDMVGSGSDGITVVNGTIYKDLLDKMQDINSANNFLKEVKLRKESCNSDHCPFYQKGVPSIFIYTRGKELQEYHTVSDTPDDFPFTAYNGLFNLLIELVSIY